MTIFATMAHPLMDLRNTISNISIDNDENLFRLTHDIINTIEYIMDKKDWSDSLNHYKAKLSKLHKNIYSSLDNPQMLKDYLSYLNEILNEIIYDINSSSAEDRVDRFPSRESYLSENNFVETKKHMMQLSSDTKEKSLKKDIFIANFNCTFGDHDEPMLSHFDDIVYPSFISDVKRNVNGSVYFFDNVRLIEYQKDEFVLAGNFIKSTSLEIRSKYDSKNGLTYTNETHPSAPYSIFIIFLKNHRMLYFRNQKGSPLLTAFAGTAKELMKKYIMQTNKAQKNDEVKNNALLPYPTLKVTPVPSEENILVQLKKVKKIKTLKLNLFPVNGDVEVSDTLNALRGDLFGTDTKTASINVSTPKNIAKTAKLIADTKGTVAPTVKAVTNQGNLITLNANSFTETINLDLNSKNTDIQNTAEIIENLHTHPSISYTSKENNSIYSKIIGIIKSKLE